MEAKKTILSLAICALLTAAMASYPMIGYAASDNSDKDSKSNDDKSDKDSEGNHDTSSKDSEGNSDVSDADDRGKSDKSSQKITVCHAPPGNPAQKHTIHIAFSAWAAHKAHTNDYLGSCNNPPVIPTTTTTRTTPEKIHVISGCTGTYRNALVTKVRSYFDPITVADTSLDDELVVTAMSQCLDKGDSSDSSDSNEKGHNSKSLSGGKGRGHDSVSVSDSGKNVLHHLIRGCQNKDTHIADSSKHGVSDSDKDATNKNYHKKLKNIDSSHDTNKGNKDPIVVSDSSLDDSDVWKEYKECAKDSGNSNKINADKTGKVKGDSGHKQHILKSCGDSQDKKLKDAITSYRAKTSTKNIILTETSYNDISVHQAVMDCVAANKGKGKDTETTGTSDTSDTSDTSGTSDTSDTSGTPGTSGTTGSTGTSGTSGTSSTGVSGRLNFRENISPIKN